MSAERQNSSNEPSKTGNEYHGSTCDLNTKLLHSVRNRKQIVTSWVIKKTFPIIVFFSGGSKVLRSGVTIEEVNKVQLQLSKDNSLLKLTRHNGHQEFQ